MEIKEHSFEGHLIAELTSDKLIISSIEEGVDLVGNLYFQGYDKAIIHASAITPSFFDLKNGMAGEVLQKFSTYRIRLALVGDFEKFNKKSLRDFIYESNQGKQVNFLPTVSDAIKAFCS